MEQKEKKIEKYLEAIERTRRERERELRLPKKEKPKKDYAVDELPEREAVRKAARFLAAKIKHRKEKKKSLERRRRLKDLLSGNISSIPKGEKEGLPVKRRQRAILFLERGVSVCIYAVLLLVPLIIIPITPSSVELPKQLIMSFFTGMAVFFWLAKMIVADKFEAKKSFLAIPIAFFVIAYLISASFSIYPDLSIWGHFSNEALTLSSTIIYVLFFCVVTNHMSKRNTVRRLLFVTLFAGFIAAVYASLQLWGIHIIELQSLENRFVNSVGTFYATAIYFTSLALLASGLYIYNRKKSVAFLYALFTAGYLTFLTFVSYRDLWLMFTLASGLILTIGISHKKMKAGRAAIMLPGIVFMFSMFILLAGRPLVRPRSAPTEMFLSRGNSMNIALQSIKENPFFGTGPGTFKFSYDMYKPSLGHFSSAGIDQPSSSVLLIFATTGLVTAASYAFLLFVLARFTIANSISVLLGRNKRADAIVTAVSVFWLYLTATSFFYIHNTILLLLWWFALAIIDINRPVRTVLRAPLSSPEDSREKVLTDKSGNFYRIDFYKVSLVVSVLFVAYMACLASFIYAFSRRYVASYYYQQALVGNNQGRPLNEIHENILQANKLDNRKDLYARNLAVVSFAMAKERANKIKGTVSGEDSKHISDFMGRSISAAEQALEINPRDFENQKNMGWVYQEMGSLNDSYLDKSLGYYQKAQTLSRNNPDLNYQIANLYLDLYNSVVAGAQKQKAEPGPKAREYLLSAEENLKQALEIDQWHFGANTLMVTVFELLGEKDAAFDKAEENAGFFSDNPQSQFALAVQLYKKGEYKRAQDRLEVVLDVRPEYANARYLLGFCQARSGNLTAALDNFEKVQRHNQDSELLAQIISDLRSGKTDFLSGAAVKETAGISEGAESGPFSTPE